MNYAIEIHRMRPPSEKAVRFIFGPLGMRIVSIDDLGELESGRGRSFRVYFKTLKDAKDALQLGKHVHESMELKSGYARSANAKSSPLTSSMSRNAQNAGFVGSSSLDGCFSADHTFGYGYNSLFHYDFMNQSKNETFQDPWDQRSHQKGKISAYDPMKYSFPTFKSFQRTNDTNNTPFLTGGDSYFSKEPWDNRQILDHRKPESKGFHASTNLESMKMLQPNGRKKHNPKKDLLAEKAELLRKLKQKNRFVALKQNHSVTDPSRELISILSSLKKKSYQVTLSKLDNEYTQRNSTRFSEDHGIGLEQYIQENDRTFTYNFNTKVIGLCDEKGCFREEDFVLAFQEILFQLGGDEEFIKLAKVGEAFLAQHNRAFKTYGRSMRTFFQENSKEFIWDDDILGSEQIKLAYVPPHLKKKSTRKQKKMPSKKTRI